VVITTTTNISLRSLLKPMYETILTQLGLSHNEAKVYEALLKIGESSIQAISLESKVHRRNVYDSIAKLQEKGLVSESFIKGEKNYKPINPERLIEIIKEKEEAVNKSLPGMQSLYKSKEPDVEAYLYKGTEGFKSYLQSILDTKETVYFIGAKAFWLDPRLEHYLRHFDKERKKRGIKFMHLFDAEIKKEKPEILKIVGKPYKFLPKEYSSSTAIDIFGPYVVTFVGVSPGKLHETPLQFVMKSQELADGYRKFFQFMWDNS
jgi:sugar-specific transcriptional regulator TrmB